MVTSKIPFKTNFNQNIVYASAHRRRKMAPIRATIVDTVQERNRHLTWALTWVLGFPICVVAIAWFLLLAIDLLVM